MVSKATVCVDWCQAGSIKFIWGSYLKWKFQNLTSRRWFGRSKWVVGMSWFLPSSPCDYCDTLKWWEEIPWVSVLCSQHQRAVLPTHGCPLLLVLLFYSSLKCHIFSWDFFFCLILACQGREGSVTSSAGTVPLAFDKWQSEQISSLGISWAFHCLFLNCHSLAVCHASLLHSLCRGLPMSITYCQRYHNTCTKADTLIQNTHICHLWFQCSVS